MQAIPAPLKPNDFESVSMTGSALGLTASKVAASAAAYIQFQGGEGYYRMDGTDPTASAGGGLYFPEDAQPILLERIDLVNFKAIASSGVYLVVHYMV